uniref:Regulator of Vps4 activity in the MVB pathway protein n=1 Tax=Kalanchoe fedtschenkoi TaxID=63787 RepID=A0A7N0VFI1_KALFE
MTRLMECHRECPDECREAVPSLMYAAARFADLPELRELRNLFSTKYGTSLDSCVSGEFVEMLELRPPTKEMKLQLLQEIAQEASVDWDLKALEQRLYTPPPQDRVSHFSNPKMDGEVTERRSWSADPSENKKPHCSGLVPPPSHYAKMKEASRAASSVSEASVENEKHKPISVRRNRSKLAATQGDQDCPKRNEEDERLDDILQRHSEPEKQKSDLQLPPYLRSYGDHNAKLPQETTDTLSPRLIQARIRAVSFDPDGATSHIHPSLPNYEDLASKIASLTGK